MKLVLFLSTMVLAAAAGFSIARISQRHVLYAQELDTSIAKINVSLKVLDALRIEKKEQAIHALETSMLVDVAALADAEKVLGKKESVTALVEQVRDYCASNHILTTGSNLPSHIAAKRFLESRSR